MSPQWADADSCDGYPYEQVEAARTRAAYNLGPCAAEYGVVRQDFVPGIALTLRTGAFDVGMITVSVDGLYFLREGERWGHLP